MSRIRDIANLFSGSTDAATDAEVVAAIGSHASASDPHGDRAAATSAISTHAALTATHGISGAIVGTTDTQTLSNKDLTAGTNSFPTSLATLTGTETLTNKTLTSPIINYGYLAAAVRERTIIDASAASGTVTTDFSSAGSRYLTVNSTGNFIFNIRGNGLTTVNSLMNTGDMWTMSLLVTNATAYYLTSLQIDGTTTGVTMKWSGGTAPSSGNANAIDVYSFTIIKTAASTYTVLAAGPVKYA